MPLKEQSFRDLPRRQEAFNPNFPHLGSRGHPCTSAVTGTDGAVLTTTFASLPCRPTMAIQDTLQPTTRTRPPLPAPGSLPSNGFLHRKAPT